MRRSKSDRAMTTPTTMEMPSRSRTSFRALLFLSENERERASESDGFLLRIARKVTSEEEKTTERESRDVAKKQIRKKNLKSSNTNNVNTKKM